MCTASKGMLMSRAGHGQELSMVKGQEGEKGQGPVTEDWVDKTARTEEAGPGTLRAQCADPSRPLHSSMLTWLPFTRV